MTTNDDRWKPPGVSRRRLLQTSIAAAGAGLVGSGSAVATARTTAAESASREAVADVEGEIACGETVDGVLEGGAGGTFPGEGYAANYYRLDEVDGEFLTVVARTVTSPDNEFPTDPLVYLLDTTGTIVAEGTPEYEEVNGTIYLSSQISAFSPPD